MGATYLVEKQGRTYWSKQKGKFGISVTESQLIEYVEYLIDNIFIRVSNQVYKKVLGIPMDTECAPLLLIYCLFHHRSRNYFVRVLS